MTTVAMTIACAMAAVLLWAALEKTRDPAATAAAIRALGLPAATSIAVTLIAAEVSVALALLLRPDSPFSQYGVVVLAACFAAAGLRALMLDHPIRCHCLGARGSGLLGTRQLIAFIPWVAGAATLRLTLSHSAPPASGAARMAALCLGIAVIRSIHLREAVREARSDRRSAEEMHSWLPSY